MANWKYSGKPPVIKQPPLPPQFPFKVDWSRLFGGSTKPTIGLSNALTFLPPKRFDAEGFSDPEFEAQRIQQNFINRQYYIPPPPGRPFEQDPKDIEKGMIPVVRKWRPDYDPTFWENPRHVAKAYLQYKSAKPGDIIPEWYDPEAFEQAYRYLEARNKGAPWYEWKYLHPDDPGRQFLQQLPMPSMDYALPKEEYQQWLTAKLMQENPESWDPNELLKLPEEVRNALLQQRQAARMITPYEELPTWQKINLRLMSSPMAQGAATMLPFAVLGGIAGAAAGLPGVALGAATPLAIGAGLGYIAQKSPTAANLLMILDYPAEWLEQALGVGLQVAGSAINPQFYGSLEEVLNNLPAAWQAAHLTATTGAYLTYGPEVPLNFQYPIPGLDQSPRGRFDLTNVMPAINYAIAYLAGNEEELKKIYFAGPNQVFLPNVAVPQTVEATGLAALVNMRREIINGADPVDVLNRYTEQFGLSGQFTELASHIVLDPLNLIPGSATKIIGRVGGLLGDVHLAHAFESSIGPIQGFKKYRNAIRTGLVAPADELTAFQRFVAGLNEEGMIKSLMPEPAPTNPIKRAFSYMVNLTPESKARLFVSHIADNIGVLLDMRRSDPDGQVALLRAVANRPPHESAEIAKFLGNPELYTGQQALKMAVPTAEALLELYHSADTPRALLRKLVKIMADPEEAKAIQNHYERLYANMPKDMREALISRATERAIEARTGSSILQQMKKMDDAETFFQHLNSRLDRLAPDLAQELRADPSFNAEGIKTMMEAFAGEKPIPWHPDEFSAHLYGAVNETTAKWAVSAYGVSPNSSFFRFFDLLKRAQSILLLGFNPNYVVGNELGNIIGRASTGVWGYSSLRTINDYMSRIGVEPYRFEAGVGAAGIVSESKLRQTEKTAVGEPIGRVSETGEEIIRKATVEASGLISKIRSKVDAASRFGIFSQASREIERLESMQTWYRGLRKTINWMWHRDNMIPKMPPEVVDWLRMNNIDPNTIYAAVEGSLNADELNVRLEGEPIRYDIDEALARVANEQGISLPMARDTLDEAYLVLQKALKDAKTPDEVRAAFAAAEDTVQKHIDTLLRENLHTRAEQVTQQVASSGFVEALRLWEEMHFTIEEYWIRHFDEWEHTFELVESLKSQGAGRDIVDRVFRARMKDAKRQWKRVRDFEKTTTKAILEGLGVDDANVRRYVDALERVGEKWDEFYSAKEKAISDVVQKVKREEFKTDAERIEAWNKVEEEFNTRYQKTAEEVARDYQEVDELFITMATEQFGENVGSTARWWRERIQQLRQDGNKLIAEFRASLVGSDGPTRRIAWEQFLNETYRPFIYRFFEELDAGAIEVYRSAMGNPPPEGAPPANPKPLPPEPTRPLPGEPSLDPEADAALSRFESYIRELTDDDGLRQQAVEDFRNRIEEAIETGELRIEIEGDAPTPDELARWRAFRDLARSMGYELSEPEIVGGAPVKATRPEVPVEIKRPEVAPEEMPKPYEGLQPEIRQRLVDYGLTQDEIEAIRTGMMTPEQMEEVISRVTRPTETEGFGANVPGRGVIGGATQPASRGVPEAPGARAGAPVAPGDQGVPEYLRTIVRPNLEYELTNPRVRQVLREDIGQHTDLRRIFSNYQRGNRAYLLSNGTGTGKTYVGMGAIVESGAKNALVVMPSRNIFGEWENAAKQFGVKVNTGAEPPDTGIFLTTYATLGKNTNKFLGKNYDFIILDESHRMKGDGQWGRGAEAIIENNPNAKLLFQSATPFQSAGQMEYLKYLGLWDTSDPLGFDRFLQEHHYTYVKPSVGPGYWRFDGDVSDILDIYRQINEKGVGSTRNLVIDQNLDNRFVRIPLDKYHRNLYDEAVRAFDNAARMVEGPYRAMINAQRTIALRRILEMSKIDETISIARRMLEEGRQVAIFTGFKGDIKPPHFKSYRLRYINQILEDFYSRINAAEGRTIQRLVDELGGRDQVAVITGDVSERMRRLEIDNYQSGRRKVLVATAASGGTGLSLHDITGNAPRAQINMYLPWSGQDFQQVAGRSYRYGSKSPVVQYWLFGDAMKEAEIASVVGGRLKEMGGLVSGIVHDLDAEKIQAFDFGLLEDERIANKVLSRVDVVEGAEIVQPRFLPEEVRATIESALPRTGAQLTETQPVIQPIRRIVGELVGKISQAVQPEAPRPAKTDLDAINALARQYKIATATERGIPTRTMLNIVNKFLRGEYGEPKNVRGEVYEPVVYRDIQDVDLELIQDALDARQRFKEFSQGSGNAVGPYPPGALESFGTPEYAGITEAAAWEQRARPLLEGIEHELLTRGTSQRNIGGMDMPPHVRSAYKRWRADVERNLSSTKLAAIRWAENLRDQALINYSKQRGIDNFLNILFPYQFWYTRSMWQWAQRMIDRPKWFANYARLRNYQRNLIAIPGFPSRLRDKMAIPAPYLPDWAGDEVWIDPLRNVFYPEQFMSPIDRLAQEQSEQEQRATYVIQRWVSEGKLGKEQAKQALMSRSGPTWELAMADAARSIQAEEGNNLDFMNLVLGPALYLTLPAYLATGKDIITGRDDIPLLPITRTGRSLKAITKNTPLHALGQAIGGIMAWPEEALRRKRGLSEFGDWGNYYVDRMLSNMAAEGKYSPREIVQAMIERDGNPLYEEAVERVRLETALRTSGALPAYALLHGAAWNNPAEFVAASLFGWLPAHLFPEGELEQRKLGELYKLAREQYNAGDPEALNRFFDEHPEYEARLALYAEPEERLRQFLISEVWERYTNLPSVDKQAVREAFGELFTRYFLDNDTRNYDALDNDTLAAWARYMGSTINIGAEGSEDVDIGRLMQAPPKEAAAVEAYRQLRNQLFPNWYAVQSMYYEYPKGSPGRQQVLERFPWLKEYWEWNREYKKANPVIAKYTSEPQDRIVVPYDLSFVREFSPALARTLLGHYSRGEPLSSGALSELRYIWNKYGRPGDDFETFLENVLPLAISP